MDQFPFYAILTSDIVFGGMTYANAGDVAIVLSERLQYHSCDPCYCVRLTGEGGSQIFEIDPESIQRLCGICLEYPAVRHARWHYGMACEACYEKEPEIIRQLADLRGDPAPQGYEKWHVEEA